MPFARACCKLCRCEPIEARVWSFGVVVDPPCFDDPARLRQVGEQMLVEAFVPQPTIEGLDKAVLGWLAGCDVVPFDTVILLPSKDRSRGQLSAVVADDHARTAAALDEPIELASDPDAGQRVVGDEGQAFPAEVVDHGEDAELATASKSIGDEVQRPALVGILRNRQRRPGAERTLTAAALPHHQPFLAIEPVELLPVQHDAFPLQQDVQASIAEPPALRRQCL